MSHPEMKNDFVPQAHDFDPSVLREYDIRGIVDKTLDTRDAFALGCAFGTYVRRQGGERVCVGYDGRKSSPAMAEALTEGLLQVGINVESVGLGPSPMLYFAVKDLLADGGIMVTGSHNPPDYNGFKMTLQTKPVYGDLIQELGSMAAAADFESGQGVLRRIDVRDTYVDRLLRDFVCKREMKVAWDAGNGAAGEILHRLVSCLPGEHILLYDDIDGDFPNHHPDPTVDENLEDLRKVVIEQGCDLGIAFDGDADRIGVIDERGKIVRCDLLMTIYIREVLAEHPGAPIIGDVKCSQIMFDEIKRLGGIPVMWKTGHSLVKAKMAETSSPLAGELSGHIFFGDKWYGFDDGLYCGLRLLKELGEAEDTLSDLFAHLPVLHSTPEIRIEVDESIKFGLVPQIANNLKALESDDFQISDLDGIRISTPEGWWLLRPSNTQNALVARAEADSATALNNMKTLMRRCLKDVGVDAVFPE